MKRNFIGLCLVFSVLLLTAGIANAQAGLTYGTIYDAPIEKSVKKLNGLLSPFSAKAGFPQKRTPGQEKLSYEELYKIAASKSKIGNEILTAMLEKYNFPIRLELGAKYFQKRLEIGSQLYSEKSGNERVFEFLCRDFAEACDKGLEELKYWSYSEGLNFDNIWFKNIQAGFIPVKEKMAKVSIPENIDPENAKEIWKEAASALMSAGSAAGLASTKVGSGGLANFPAWRLKYCIKYFKVAAKAAVVKSWHSRNCSTKYWIKACNKLRKDVDQINADMEKFLAKMQ
jgi:hypothetical protein